jgi:hypothetical protein
MSAKDGFKDFLRQLQAMPQTVADIRFAPFNSQLNLKLQQNHSAFGKTLSQLLGRCVSLKSVPQ